MHQSRTLQHQLWNSAVHLKLSRFSFHVTQTPLNVRCCSYLFLVLWCSDSPRDMRCSTHFLKLQLKKTMSSRIQFIALNGPLLCTSVHPRLILFKIRHIFVRSYCISLFSNAGSITLLSARQFDTKELHI